MVVKLGLEFETVKIGSGRPEKIDGVTCIISTSSETVFICHGELIPRQDR